MSRRAILSLVAGLGVFTWNAGVQAQVVIDTVTVGNPGNAADTRYETPGYGSVDYDYNIGTFEVTAGHYTAFLNAVAATDTYGLYSSGMDSSSYGCKITQHGNSGSYWYDFSGGVVSATGGCAPLGNGNLGMASTWARVATLRVRAEAVGGTGIGLAPASQPFGVSIFGEFGNVDPSRIEVGDLALNIHKRTKPRRASRENRE